MITYTNGEDMYKAIKAAIAEQGLTVSKLADMMGTAQPLLSRAITTFNPRLNNVRDILAAMGCHLEFQIVPDDKEQ